MINILYNNRTMNLLNTSKGLDFSHNTSDDESSNYQ